MNSEEMENTRHDFIGEIAPQIHLKIVKYKW